MTFKTDWVGDIGWGVLAKNYFAVNERINLKIEVKMGQQSRRI